jgi:transposase-like protein
MPIEFPIVDLMSNQSSYEWLLAYFHPTGMGCPHCRAGIEEARRFRNTRSSQVPDYRCRVCGKTYNVYSGTVFEGRRLKPQQVVLLVRGIVKGEQAQILANEVGVCRQTVQAIRQQMQSNAQRMQPDNPLEGDEQTETDELYQNAGEKRGAASRSR